MTKDHFAALYGDATQPVFVFEKGGEPIYHNGAAANLAARLRLGEGEELLTNAVRAEWKNCLRYQRGASVPVWMEEEQLVLFLLPQEYQGETFLVLRSEERSALPEQQAVARILQNSRSKLNGYLNGIYGVAQRLGLSSQEGARLGEEVRHIMRMSEHLARLLETDDNTDYLAPVDAGLFLAGFARSFMELHPDRQVMVMPCEPNLYVRMMPENMEMALANLLSNAARFGNGQILLRAEKREGQILLSVMNDGPAPCEPDRLFEWGYRTMDAKGARGLGYSLPMIRKLLALQGADLFYEREEGLTSFTIAMEAIELPEGGHLAEWHPEPTTNSLSQLRIELSDI